MIEWGANGVADQPCRAVEAGRRCKHQLTTAVNSCISHPTYQIHDLLQGCYIEVRSLLIKLDCRHGDMGDFHEHMPADPFRALGTPLCTGTKVCRRLYNMRLLQKKQGLRSKL